jgi:RNA polymerase sigma factor (sigma-70 family)
MIQEDPSEPLPPPNTPDRWPACPVQLETLRAGVTDGARDPVAWRAVRDTYEPYINAWLRGRGLSSHDQREVAADVWRWAVEHIADVRASETFGSWLRSSTHGRFVDYVRASAARAKYEGTAAHASVLATDGDALEDLIQYEGEAERTTDAMQRVAQILEVLRPQDRKYLELYLKGYDHKALARLMGYKSPKVSEQRLSRIKKRIAKDANR